MIININKDKAEIQGRELINSGAVRYYEVDLVFDESWNGLAKVAKLLNTQTQEATDIAIIDDKKIYIDAKCHGPYTIGFIGYTIENEIKTYQISTNLEPLYIDRGAGEIIGSNRVPTPTEWELYLAQIQEIINGASEEITNNVFNTINPILKEIEETAETAESIAKGANQSLSYEDYSAMITNFNAFEAKQFNIGQNIMIKTLNVPDLWVYEYTEEKLDYTYTTDEDFVNILKEQGYVQVGWYKLAQLETQKVDLTGYLEKEDIEEEVFEITYENGTTRTVRSVVFK